MQKLNQAIFNRKNASTIPAEYGLTPGGYRHRSLIHHVPKGQRVERFDNRLRQVETLSGRQVELYSRVPKDLVTPDIGSGWITYASWSNDSGSPISRFITKWMVPAAPSTLGSQTIFFFNAIEDSPQDDIVQPVLQWGASGAGGGNFWSIANWYVASSGHASYSSLQRVNPGDLLIGIISLVSQDAIGFNYTSSFQNYPNLDLGVGSISELVWATETLEAYQLGACSEYPNSPSTSMGSIEVVIGAAHPHVSWKVTNRVTDCGQSSNIVNSANPGGQIDFLY
jgi:hypothetical protein